jgi:hypothetical protein
MSRAVGNPVVHRPELPPEAGVEPFHRCIVGRGRNLTVAPDFSRSRRFFRVFRRKAGGDHEPSDAGPDVGGHHGRAGSDG